STLAHSACFYFYFFLFFPPLKCGGLGKGRGVCPVPYAQSANPIIGNEYGWGNSADCTRRSRLTELTGRRADTHLDDEEGQKGTEGKSEGTRARCVYGERARITDLYG